MTADTISKVCPDSGRRFFVSPEDVWKSQCLACWKASRGLTRPDASSDRLRRRVDQAEDRADRLELENARLREQLARGGSRTSSLPGLDARAWRWAVQCTHLDKHPGSSAAHTVCQWLNSIRTSITGETP